MTKEHVRNHRCSNCKFFLPRTVEGKTNRGECHRYPPFYRGEATDGGHPIVLWDGLCGEWIRLEVNNTIEDPNYIQEKAKK